MSITEREFGKTPDGAVVTLFTLSNAAGNVVKLTNYGAIIVEVDVPDRDGVRKNVTLGFPELDGYLQRHPYFGATVGRFCNRIARGQFTLDGHEYALVVNNGPNHLHGGTIGFDKLLWDAEVVETDDQSGIRFTTISPDGQEGYPGTLKLTAEYTWSDQNELAYTFQALTDQATVINMTNHAYWNLAGVGQGKIYDHELQLYGQRYLEVDETLIPTGELLSVAGTPLDFRTPQTLGARIDQLQATKGYDHCFVIDGAAGELRTAAIVRDPRSGRTMEVRTTQPGVQLYTGNHLNLPHPPHSGFCLETQHFPDSPNRPEFPSTRLDPGQIFRETTLHHFSVS